jgi:hypothetical protein
VSPGPKTSTREGTGCRHWSSGLQTTFEGDLESIESPRVGTE